MTTTDIERARDRVSRAQQLVGLTEARLRSAVAGEELAKRKRQRASQRWADAVKGLEDARRALVECVGAVNPTFNQRLARERAGVEG